MESLPAISAALVKLDAGPQVAILHYLSGMRAEEICVHWKNTACFQQSGEPHRIRRVISDYMVFCEIINMYTVYCRTILIDL